MSEADVICVQETKAKPEQIPGGAIPDEWEIHWNSSRRPGYAGVATFMRKPVQVESFKGIGVAEHDNEGRVLRTEFPALTLVNAYIPNAQRDLSRLGYRCKEWSPAFLKFLWALKKKKPVLLCGDMNVAHKEIDLARPRENVGNAGFTPEERACFEDVLGLGFLDAFRLWVSEGGHYTWWSYQNQSRQRNIGWRIDYFLLTPELRPYLLDAFHCPEILGSDHCPVVVDFAKEAVFQQGVV
ncbi:MAG: exodeoxyribonuclease III, partial [Chthoniobacterales bacterium]|nr:exodeoxyribonuclease III [Chthoniobacterales bacterium]